MTADLAARAERRLVSAGGAGTRVGLILGSGLGGYAGTLENRRSVRYQDIGGFPVSAVPGHENRFVLGSKFGVRVVAMQGRFHYYEGYPMPVLALGVRAMRRIGVDTLIITNAAGGVNLSFQPGTLMMISDHINLSGGNPLIGPNDPKYGVRFPDMTNVYDRALRQKLKASAAEAGISLSEGVYAMMSGPSFETPAEIRMCRAIGADAVGMSTVPEAIAAAHCGIRVLGISLITNMAAGVLDQPLSHEEVNRTAAAAEERFCALLDRILSCVVADA